MFLINRTPSPVISDISPYEKLYNAAPQYAHFCIFGCLCYASTISAHHSKFDPRATKCVFLDFKSSIKYYKVMDLETKHYVSRCCVL